MSTEVTIDGSYKTCDMPGCTGVARYDVKSNDGRWGNFCPIHYRTETPRRLGTGMGQRLIYRDEDANEARRILAKPEAATELTDAERAMLEAVASSRS